MAASFVGLPPIMPHIAKKRNIKCYMVLGIFAGIPGGLCREKVADEHA